HASPVAGKENHISQLVLRGKLDVLLHLLDQPRMVFLSIPPIGNRAAAAQYGTRQAERLDLLIILRREQLNRLIPNPLRFFGKLLERHAVVAPPANGLLDMATDRNWLRSFKPPQRAANR